MKHFEFVPGDTIEIAPGKVLHRIRATVDIEIHGVKKGDLGGYIESPENLDGQAWVADYAKVYGDAKVYDNAQISGDALVYGIVWVSGNVKISGDACVYDDGLIFWVSKVGSDNKPLTVYNTKSGELEVTNGRFCGSINDFLTESEAEHVLTHLEYRLLIEAAALRITRTRERLAQAV